MGPGSGKGRGVRQGRPVTPGGRYRADTSRDSSLPPHTHRGGRVRGPACLQVTAVRCCQRLSGYLTRRRARGSRVPPGTRTSAVQGSDRRHQTACTTDTTGPAAGVRKSDDGGDSSCVTEFGLMNRSSASLSLGPPTKKCITSIIYV